MSTTSNACAQCGGPLTRETRGEIETVFATCHRGSPTHRGVRDGWFLACDRCEAVVEVLNRKEGAS